MEKPSEEQIQQTIKLVQSRLAEPNMAKPVNRNIRQGYQEVVNILLEGRETYDGIDKLDTLRGRAIAVLGVDYLNGECEQKVLVGVPLNIER